MDLFPAQEAFCIDLTTSKGHRRTIAATGTYEGAVMYARSLAVANGYTYVVSQGEGLLYKQLWRSDVKYTLGGLLRREIDASPGVSLVEDREHVLSFGAGGSFDPLWAHNNGVDVSKLTIFNEVVLARRCARELG
jgi:hypothetical protein